MALELSGCSFLGGYFGFPSESEEKTVYQAKYFLCGKVVRCDIMLRRGEAVSPCDANWDLERR